MENRAIHFTNHLTSTDETHRQTQVTDQTLAAQTHRRAMDSLRRNGGRHDGVFLYGLQRYGRLYASGGGAQESARPLRFSDLFGRRRRAGTLLPQHRQPSVCRLRRDLSECDRRTYFNRGFTFRGSFGHRRQGFGPSGRKDPATRTAQRRRRLHHHTAACKAAVFAGVARSDEPCDAETYRMDDSNKARAVLFERRDHQNVSQPV